MVEAFLRSLPLTGSSATGMTTGIGSGVTSGGGFPNKERTGHYAADAPMGKRGGQGKWKGAALANGYDDYNDGIAAVRKGSWPTVIQKMTAAIRESPPRSR